MGIEGFNEFLKKKYNHLIYVQHISIFAYQRIFFDISSYIYKYIFVYGTNNYVWLEKLFNLMIMFKQNQVRIVPIFDGKPPEEKQDEITQRKQQKQKIKDKIVTINQALYNYENNINSEDDINILKDVIRQNNRQNNKGKNLLFNEKEDEDNILNKEEIEIIKNYINKTEKQTLYITIDFINKIKEMLTIIGIPFIQAEGETESLCCSLVKQKIGTAVISVDTDCFAYCCPIIIKNLDINGNISFVILEEFLKELEFTEDQLIDLCILCGCDYNRTNKLYNVGPNKAYNLIKQFRQIENITGYSYEDIEKINYKNCRKLFNFINDKTYDLTENKIDIEMITNFFDNLEIKLTEDIKEQLQNINNQEFIIEISE